MYPSLGENQIWQIEVRPNHQYILHRLATLILTLPHLVTSSLSTNKIPSSVDAVMDRQIPTNGRVVPGVSMVNGTIKEEDHDTSMVDVGSSLANGAAKRKARPSLTRPAYADAESSDDDDDLPLVCIFLLSCRSHF